jgi:fluoride exporter
MDKYLVVMAGAAAGGLARYLAGAAIMERFGGRFPLGTLVINVTGSFLIGVLMPLLTERGQPHPNWRLLLVVGFLGGYTTFSSFAWETYQAMRSGDTWVAVVNAFGSLALGMAAVWMGATLVTRR